MTGQIPYLPTDISSIWLSIFLIASASFLLFLLLLDGNNFFLITFVNVVLYFDLHCLLSSAILLVFALSNCILLTSFEILLLMYTVQ